MITEETNPHSKEIDALPIQEIIRIMNEENLLVTEAVRAASDSISMAVRDAVNAIRSGGRLIYIGAGTSGRLGALDASEIPPTFSVSPDVVRGMVAGGNRALTEGIEDDAEAGIQTVAGITDRDMLIGITASGTTPFTLAALKEAKRHGPKCWLLTCNDIAYDFL